ncbi:MAG: methyltransferase domain-containing protein [Planctomycetes bacterium]|nr:methyltransferase domain-containing protein [Planctomycetota bacterium]
MAQATVSKFFDSYAGDFNAIYGTKNTMLNRLLNKYLRASMRIRFEKVLESCDPIQGKSVIDIGSGPGHFSISLARSGADHVLGIDFAESMNNLAKHHAEQAGVADRCRFDFGDFLLYEIPEQFDYAIVMGFMDYIADPSTVIRKVLSATRGKAMFSFPSAGGFLAWQRKLRYRKRCELYMYTAAQLEELFSQAGDHTVKIERIARDFLVTVTIKGSST